MPRKTIDSTAELIAGGNAIDVKKLKLLRTTLEAKLSELQALDQDIVELLEDDSKIDQDVAESCELSSAIREGIVNLEAVFSAEETQRKSQEFASTNQSVSNSEGVGISQSQLSKVTTHAKLRKLKLQKYHGSPIDWYPFWESSESAVHKNPNLSGVDKLNYLKSLLVGTAQNEVTGLALTSANYAKVVELFQKRFGNRQMVISSHMEALTKIPKITSIS